MEQCKSQKGYTEASHGPCNNPTGLLEIISSSEFPSAHVSSGTIVLVPTFSQNYFLASKSEVYESALVTLQNPLEVQGVAIFEIFKGYLL